MKNHIEDFRQHLIAKRYTFRSIGTYINHTKSFLESNPKGDGYQYGDIVDYFDRLSKTRLSLATRKGILASLKRYYEFLVYARHRKDNPCGGFYIRGGIDKAIIQGDLFTMEELEQMMNRTDEWGKQPQRNRLIFSLYIHQALTSEEIGGLTLTDVDTDKGTILIARGKRRNERLLDLVPRQYSLIYQYIHGERKKLSHKNSSSTFILNQYGNTSSHDSIVDSLLLVKEAFPGRIMNALTIRKSVISYWLNVLKIPIEDVQLLAGIKWVSSIERYQHVSVAEEREVLKQFHPLG